jgi:hypothetical protein
MNSDLATLREMRDRVIGLEMAITLTMADLIVVEKDLDYLEGNLLILQENIEVLKSEKIIAVAAEYKKVAAELKTAKKSFAFFKQLRNKLESRLEKQSAERDSALIEYETSQSRYDNRNFVLPFDPLKRKK